MVTDRILLVKNDKDFLDDIEVILKQLGYDCTVFADGQEDSYALENSYDLVLLNIGIFERDGLKLLAHMNQKKIPVICLVPTNDTLSEIKALRVGAEDCVSKSVDWRILLARIKKVLQRKGTMNTIVRLEDAMIDLAKRTVSKNGRKILLNPKEFEVLSMLIRNKNQILSRQRILDEVWGVDYFGGTHTVDVKISSLRKKLGFQRVIKTVPKCGYILGEKLLDDFSLLDKDNDEL